jgi:hypothetical protein
MASIITSLDDQVAADQVECLNMDPESELKNLFVGNSDNAVRSDIDPQLLVTIPFKAPVRLSGIKFSYNASTDSSMVPESIKLFANRVSMGFSDAEGLPALQTLSHSEIVSNETIPLKLALFQNVVSLQLFVDCNVGGADKSELGRISLFGMMGEKMDMREFKKIKDDE